MLGSGAAAPVGHVGSQETGRTRCGVFAVDREDPDRVSLLIDFPFTIAVGTHGLQLT